MTSAKKRVFVLVAVFASFFVHLAATALLGKIFGGTSVINVLVPYTGAFLSSVLVLGGMMKFFPEDAEGEIVTDGEHEKSSPTVSKTKNVLTAVLSVALMLAVNFLLSFIMGDTAVPSKTELLLRAAAGVILYPAMEEYLFRCGYLRALLKGSFPRYVAIILQAALFASVHRGGAIPVAFICGIILGVLYVKAQGKHAFFAVYLAHALYNGVLYLTLALS